MLSPFNSIERKLNTDAQLKTFPYLMVSKIFVCASVQWRIFPQLPIQNWSREQNHAPFDGTQTILQGAGHLYGVGCDWKIFFNTSSMKRIPFANFSHKVLMKPLTASKHVDATYHRFEHLSNDRIGHTWQSKQRGAASCLRKLLVYDRLSTGSFYLTSALSRLQFAVYNMSDIFAAGW